MDSLFDIPESPIPPLESARRRLTRAIEREREACNVHDAQGPEGHPSLEITTSERRMAEKEVEMLEREALR